MYLPNFLLIISLSLIESPQLFTTITSDFFNFRAIFIVSANAWDGSNDGEIFSNFDTILCAAKASSSVADVYLLF